AHRAAAAGGHRAGPHRGRGDPGDLRVGRVRPPGEALRRKPVTSPRLAVNPIAYWLAGGVPDRTTRTLGPAFTELAGIGYTAVKADVPDDMRAEDYLPWLASFGLEPALSLFSGAFDDPG